MRKCGRRLTRPSGFSRGLTIPPCHTGAARPAHSGTGRPPAARCRKGLPPRSIRTRRESSHSADRWLSRSVRKTGHGAGNGTPGTSLPSCLCNHGPRSGLLQEPRPRLTDLSNIGRLEPLSQGCNTGSNPVGSANKSVACAPPEAGSSMPRGLSGSPVGDGCAQSPGALFLCS